MTYKLPIQQEVNSSLYKSYHPRCDETKYTCVTYARVIVYHDKGCRAPLNLPHTP